MVYFNTIISKLVLVLMLACTGKVIATYFFCKCLFSARFKLLKHYYRYYYSYRLVPPPEIFRFQSKNLLNNNISHYYCAGLHGKDVLILKVDVAQYSTFNRSCLGMSSTANVQKYFIQCHSDTILLCGLLIQIIPIHSISAYPDNGSVNKSET